jgi:hypothetical protein
MLHMVVYFNFDTWQFRFAKWIWYFKTLSKIYGMRWQKYPTTHKKISCKDILLKFHFKTDISRTIETLLYIFKFPPCLSSYVDHFHNIHADGFKVYMTWNFLFS